MNKLVLDLETKETFDDVGGQSKAHLLSVSVVGVYWYPENKYMAFTENAFDKLDELLSRTDQIIGFNTEGFDLPVLQKYVKTDLSRISSIDLLSYLKDALGRRIKLDNFVKATLGIGKSGHGLEAIEWYKQGKIKEIIDYCLMDVRLTRDLYEYGLRHKKVFYTHPESQQVMPVEIDWAKAKTVQRSML